MKIKEWINTDLAEAIWSNKYQFNNETFDEWLDRVSNKNEKLKQLIIEKKFLFGGRILANRGLDKKGLKVTYSNCYVIPKVEDNLESIFDTAKYLARTYSYGGGCGVDISNLRPNGMRVHNAADTTTGSISFMDLYSKVTEIIGARGRRGALMISIICTHPDLLKFIDIKNDLDKVTKANISIRILDDFMKAVKEDADWTLYFYNKEYDDTYKETHKAKDIYRKICENNWNMAEPGMLFWDKIDNWNLLSEDNEFEFAGTNPCFTEDMQLLTDKGYIPIGELDGQQVNIINKNGNITNGKVWCSGEKETIIIKLTSGKELKCTPNHIFMLNNEEECQAKDLKGKRLMPYTTREFIENPLYIKLGFIQGDGCTGRINSDAHKGIEVNIGYHDEDIKLLFNKELIGVTPSRNRAYYVHGFNNTLVSLGFDGSQLPERVFPITYTSWDINQKANFLNGCYSANGSIITHYRISYKTTSRIFALQLKKALEEFNITANITTNKPQKVTFDNGEYECKESYDININKYKDITTFYKFIGFYQKYKMNNLLQLIKEKSPMVTCIKSNGIQKVYDFTEPEIHWGIIEGFVAHNCAEEPLPAGGSCLLGSINLSEFVQNEFTNEAVFNEEDFKNTVKLSIKALNEILLEGLPLHPLEIQRQSVNDWRQLGLGVMGIADLLLKLNLKYGDKKSLEFCDKIGFIMINEAIKTSALIAKKQGTYPKYKEEAILNSLFFIANTTKETKELIKKYGLAHSQLLTIAPTGSLSTMLGISGGIEPIYNISYVRKTESLHDKDVFYKVYTPIAERYMKLKSITEEENLPDMFVTAMTLNYKDRIEMQSIWQQHIDASISSTVNVPNEFTIENTEELYMLAWEKGLKGITIFRDGCARSGVLTNTIPTTEENTKKQTTLPRGTILEVDDSLIGKKRKLQTGCGSLHVESFFSPDTGDMMEVYLSKGSSGGCNAYMVGLSRMISISLRGGVPLESLVDQLDSVIACPSYAVRNATKHDTSKGKCCPDAIGRALMDMQNEMWNEIINTDEEIDDTINNIPIEQHEKQKDNYLSDEEKQYIKNNGEIAFAQRYNKCPHCGSTLRQEGGCVTCNNCGFSRCD
jgi:ribonucleotide reductase alpha subunit